MPNLPNFQFCDTKFMRTDLFDFELPEGRIALRPADPRDSAKMLVVQPDGGLSDATVRALPDLLRPADVLVVNDTRVIAAALEGTRTRGDARARIVFNLIKRSGPASWRAFARPAKRLDVGDIIQIGTPGRVCFAGELQAKILEKGEAGEVELGFSLAGAYLDAAIDEHGQVPLPPYIALKRTPDEADKASYQTIYAAREGAVAAPTAGLHFTPELFERLAARGIERHTVTLHVGAGTFLPVKAEDTDEHKMHSEWGEISSRTAAALNEARARGGRIVAVGTTSLRVLESAADANNVIHPWCGETDIFIVPGYRFKAVDVLLTNFHLPKSTLFMLVSAFSGLDAMQAAYAHAIANDYRFYSYGDACLLQRAG